MVFAFCGLSSEVRVYSEGEIANVLPIFYLMLWIPNEGWQTVEADDDWENMVERTRDTGCVSLILELDVRRLNSQGETRRPFMPLGSPSDLLVPETDGRSASWVELDR